MVETVTQWNPETTLNREKAPSVSFLRGRDPGCSAPLEANAKDGQTDLRAVGRTDFMPDRELGITLSPMKDYPHLRVDSTLSLCINCFLPSHQ